MSCQVYLSKGIIEPCTIFRSLSSSLGPSSNLLKKNEIFSQQKRQQSSRENYGGGRRGFATVALFGVGVGKDEYLHLLSDTFLWSVTGCTKVSFLHLLAARKVASPTFFHFLLHVFTKRLKGLILLSLTLPKT